MSHLFWLDQEHVTRIKHMFPKPRGVTRSDDLKVLSGIIHVIRNGLRWRDAPSEYGPHKTLYNRFVRWSRLGVFARVLRELAEPGSDGDTIMIDSTHLQAHRTAASRSKGELGHGQLVEPTRPEQQVAHSLRRTWPSSDFLPLGSANERC